MPDTNFTFRVDADLKDAFLSAAQGDNRNASLLLRSFMRNYVMEHTPPTAPKRNPGKKAAPRRRLTASARS